MTKQGGFTLLEVMLSVVMIGILTGLSLPLYNSFAARNDLDNTTQQVVAALRRAETYARDGRSDSAWSVEIQSSAVTLFKGTVFATRDAAYDETVTLPGSATASGLSEVQFAKLSAAPSATGNITLTSTSNTTRTISINAKGTIDF